MRLFLRPLPVFFTLYRPHCFFATPGATVGTVERSCARRHRATIEVGRTRTIDEECDEAIEPGTTIDCTEAAVRTESMDEGCAAGRAFLGCGAHDGRGGPFETTCGAHVGFDGGGNLPRGAHVGRGGVFDVPCCAYVRCGVITGDSGSKFVTLPSPRTGDSCGENVPASESTSRASALSTLSEEDGLGGGLRLTGSGSDSEDRDI
mmetsp:Transcript_36948/g.69075  ORF Transcript_36948/g.69075 Transcript_36948/m.69075 type:complete len:205 (-) Transcript_36948:70-684(-)